MTHMPASIASMTQNGPPRAVLYLRVSTPGQVKTDYDPEGLSIPAQREACQRKAAQMGVEIADEYIEPGRSGREMDKRPAFQAMLQRIRDERDVQYVIVYKLSRMNRNRFDDAVVVMELRQLKVTLISATENIDETPVGQLMHGLLASFNEYRSAEDGADIRYKMGQKAKNGGTLGRAKIGYQNVRETFEGREIRTVALDPDRAPYISLAFELFVTGDYTLQGLADELTIRGLRTRPGRYPAGPISDSKLADLLRDRYYLGYVTYQGVEYEGRHPPLVTPELFDRVQLVLESKSTAGERRRVHHHYLKGSLWCWRCHKEDGHESRMVITCAKGNGGAYFYFFCPARRTHACSDPHRDMYVVEDAVLRHYLDLYAQLEAEPSFTAQVRAVMQSALDDRDQAARLLQQQLTAQLAKLEVQEENLLDLAADGGVPQTKVRQRLHRIQEQRTKLQEDLGDVDIRLDVGVALLEAALALLDNLQELYRQSTDNGRRLLNQAFFRRLYVGEDGIEEADINEPFRELFTVQRDGVGTTSQGSRDDSSIGDRDGTVVDLTRKPKADLLTVALSGHGLNRTAMVEVMGFEPTAPSMRPKCSSQLSYTPEGRGQDSPRCSTARCRRTWSIVVVTSPRVRSSTARRASRVRRRPLVNASG